ncbi:hypothetical protein PIB30_056669 [Stylosanthes scabra]|uniref:C-JID domain-containing protein n=1 Tax=Stylosanthes scabra TaxID=79078 RepID=A0ABU6XKF1_9FABA|nr:hypothetical protein [Stylosanthes scabra]
MGVAIRYLLDGMLKYEKNYYFNGSWHPKSYGQVLYPGNKVPSWFTYQTRESSLIVDLVADQPYHMLVGFILCCVVYHIPSQRGDPVRSAKRRPVIRCHSYLGYTQQFTKMRRWSSDHVCIWFEKVDHNILDGNNLTFKFEAGSFRRYSEGRSHNELLQYEWKVTGCGVCPVYASDILDVFQNVDPEFQFFYEKYYYWMHFT